MSDRVIVMFGVGLSNGDGLMLDSVCQYTDYTRIAWQSYCDKYEIDFVFVDKHTDERDWQTTSWRVYSVFDYVDACHVKIGLVESDTMPNFNAPDIFESYTNEFCGVVDTEFLKHIVRIQSTFDEIDGSVDYDKYINGGVLLFTKDHKYIFDHMIDFYFKQNYIVDHTVKKSQTVLNHVLRRDDVDVKYLDFRYNTMGLNHNGWMSYNWQTNDKSTPFMIKYSYIWHFTDHIMMSDRDEKAKLISAIWNNLKSFYSIDHKLDI